jgi:hypothetical protein
MNPLIEIWRSILVGKHKSWVLFKNGTCVVLMDPDTDLAAQAITLMKQWGEARGHPSICSHALVIEAGWSKARLAEERQAVAHSLDRHPKG